MRGSIWLMGIVAMMAGLILVGCTDSEAAPKQGKLDVKAEVMTLLKADVGEAVIVSYLEREGAPEAITAAELVGFKKAGATDGVLLALMGKTAVASGGAEFPFDLDENHTVDKPVVEGSLAVYAIRRIGPTSADTYLTLDEATDQKLVVIKEKDGGSVPVAEISNIGKLPIYISAGEVVLGGKQDRMIAFDVIIKAGKKMTVEVRCVEQGRWNGSDHVFQSAKAMGGRKSRGAVQFKKQGDVWQEVAAQNSAVGVRSGTGSYRATLDSTDIKKKVDRFSRTILPALEGRHVVGMVVAVNGKVHSIEIFGSPSLFGRLKEKLLKSCALDAISEKEQNKPAPGKKAILGFYNKTMAAREKALKAYDANKNMMRESDEAILNMNSDGAGNTLRTSILAK